jgi:hypothetical protein
MNEIATEKNSIEELLKAHDMLPEPQRQRILGIAEGIAIAVGSDTHASATK